MKTKLLLSALLFSFNSLVFAQCPGTPDPGYTCIPDDHFEQALIDLNIDTNATIDGQVLTAAIESVTSLDVHSYFISDMTGIEGFAALETLNCRSNNLTTLNLFNNTALTHIECYANFISNLTMPNNNTLTYLNCGNNNLSSINLSSYPDLNYLAIYNNDLTQLNLSSNNALTYINCRTNSISDLTLPNSAPNLYYLHCAQNSLTALNLSSVTGLEQLYCYENNLNSIDLQYNPFLLILWIWTNNLSALDLTNNSSLIDIDCGDNSINSINTLQIPNIQIFYCYNNNLSSLDVSNNSDLVDIDCGNNSSLSLTLPNIKTNLKYLWVYGTNMSTLNYDEYISLQKLDIGINNFTNADVSMLSDLYQFYCNQNQLTSLNIANGNIDNFTWMWAQDNPTGLCIQVDDTGKAQAKSSPNWQRDPGSTFSLNCGLGLEEFKNKNVSIYPNPTKEKFFIDLQLEANYTLSNVFGQEVKKGLLVSGTNELETNTLSTGIYLLKIDSPEGSMTKKLIKQ